MPPTKCWGATSWGVPGRGPFSLGFPFHQLQIPSPFGRLACRVPLLLLLSYK